MAYTQVHSVGANGAARLLRLAQAVAVLGVAEGLETAFAAIRLMHRLPVWSALNAGLLGKFEPPIGTERVLIFADRDAAGLEAND